MTHAMMCSKAPTMVPQPVLGHVTHATARAMMFAKAPGMVP